MLPKNCKDCGEKFWDDSTLSNRTTCSSCIKPSRKLTLLNKFLTFTSITFISLFLLVTTSSGKNLIGWFLHYGTCPNCGDSFYWKPTGSIGYETLQEGKDFTVKGGGIIAVEASYGVLVCEECLAKPETLDEGRIKIDLISNLWDSDKAEKVREAVVAYKLQAVKNKKLLDKNTK